VNKIALILLSLFLTIGCDKDSNKSTLAPSGHYILDIPAEDGSTTVLTVSFNPGNKAELTMYYRASGASTVYYRGNIASYSVSGSIYTFNYSYETCNPVGAESINIPLVETDKITIDVNGVLLTLFKVNNIDESIFTSGVDTFTEDVDCNLIP